MTYIEIILKLVPWLINNDINFNITDDVFDWNYLKAITIFMAKIVKFSNKDIWKLNFGLDILVYLFVDEIFFIYILIKFIHLLEYNLFIVLYVCCIFLCLLYLHTLIYTCIIILSF